MIRILLALVALLFLGYTASTSLTQVRPGERGIIRRFGRILPEKPGPGLNIGWPWGIDVVERVPVGKIRRIEVGFTGRDDSDTNATPPGQLLTGDHNLVNVQADIQFRVVEAEVELFFLNSDRADVLVARAAEAVLAEWIAGRNVDEVLLRGKSLLPGELIARVQERLRPYDLGVQIEEASITRLNPPEEVKDAFDRVAQAQNGILTQVNAAHQAAQTKLRDAQAAVFHTQSMTGAYARGQVLQAQIEALNFGKRLDQYRRLSADNPSYLNVLWLDEMTRNFAKMQQDGRLDVLDHYLTGEGLNILQFPALPKKK